MFEIDAASLPFVQTRQALLILDLQNDFLSPDARIPIDQPPSFVDRILKIVPEFRPTGTVIWIRSVFKASRPVNGDGDGSEQVITDNEVTPKSGRGEKSRRRISDHADGYSGRNGAIRSRMANLAKLMDPDSDEEIEVYTDETFLTVPSEEKPKCLLPRSPAVELVPAAVKVQDTGKDIVLDKSHYSAFKDGTLVQLLRSRFVTEIYICGALSNMSVYATAMDATQFGYAITLIDDCLGYRDQERHNETMRRLEVSTGCDNILTPDLLKDLRQKARMTPRKAPSPAPNSRRPESSKQVEKKTQDPDLDSMISKLRIDSEDPSIPRSSKDLSLPQAPIDTATPPLAVVGSGGSFESTAEESQVPSSPLRKPSETPDKSNRVQTKIRTRKKPSKKPKESESSSVPSAASSEDKLASAKPNSSKESTSSKANMSKDTPVSKVKKASSPSGPKESTDSPVASKVQAPAPAQKESKPQPTSKSDISKLTEKIEGLTTSESSPVICEGDTTIIQNLLKGDLAEGIFERIRDEVRWQKMSHQGGDVPRLVAVQGRIGDDKSIPIYRHPADESPPLLPFTPTVSLIREQAEKELGHPLNHVLIQLYRDGTDYISEHSDKTLDIVPKTYIVNVSLGAQRTMIFRTKKQTQQQPEKSPAKSPGKSSDVPSSRQVVRAPMPHNSMCKVGLVTNMRWLHGIRQDKRLASEKSNAELAYKGARISLTFRQIGTFLSSDQQKIWGQGAVSKSKEKANFVINGDTPEAEKMIRAFGQENHSSEFDWTAHYGSGFDVLHLNNTPKLFLSGDRFADDTVKLALQAFGINWEEGKLSPSFKWKDEHLEPGAPEIRQQLPIRFVDNDLSKSTTTGGTAVLLYLNAVYGPQLRPQPETAKLFSRLQTIEDLSRKVASVTGKTLTAEDVAVELDLLGTYAQEADFIAGNDASITDWKLLPALEDLYQKDENIFTKQLGPLKTYYLRVRAEEKVVKVLGSLEVDDEKNVTDGREVPRQKKLDTEELRSDDDDDDDDDDEGEDEDEDAN